MAKLIELKRAAVLGFPVSHSLSPRLHNYWLKKYNIVGSYEAIAVPPGELEQTLRALPQNGFAGVNLTIPHKEAALALVSETDDIARSIGAVNTIIVKSGKLFGMNTDAYGFMQNLHSMRKNQPRGNALVLGAGGAARAICAGLLGEGWKVTLANRTRKKAEAIAANIKGRINVADWNDRGAAMEDAALLVNTTPLGMKGQPPLDIDLRPLSLTAYVYDIVYAPAITPLLATARARGNPTIEGLGMLLYQAQPAFEAWFGIRPEVTSELMHHMLEAIA